MSLVGSDQSGSIFYGGLKSVTVERSWETAAQNARAFDHFQQVRSPSGVESCSVGRLGPPTRCAVAKTKDSYNICVSS